MSHASPLARLHSLWTLEGLAQLTPSTLRHALTDPHPKVRAAAIRLAEPLLSKKTQPNRETAALRTELLKSAAQADSDVQIQLALSLSLLPPDTQTRSILQSIASNSSATLASKAASFTLASFAPKEPAQPPLVKGRPLTQEETKRFDAGKGLYGATCLPCHQEHGLGQPGLAPALAQSEWVSGSEQRLILIVLNGLRGPITVKGEKFDLEMPPLAILDDEQIAAVLTYVRREWGHSFDPVTPSAVQQTRQKTGRRTEAWTMAELLKIP